MALRVSGGGACLIVKLTSMFVWHAFFQGREVTRKTGCRTNSMALEIFETICSLYYMYSMFKSNRMLIVAKSLYPTFFVVIALVHHRWDRRLSNITVKHLPMADGFEQRKSFFLPIWTANPTTQSTSGVMDMAEKTQTGKVGKFGSTLPPCPSSYTQTKAPHS